MEIKDYIKDVHDYPRKGIVFKDIQPLLMNPEAFNEVIDLLIETARDADVIVAPDARGFIFGTPVAAKLNKPFVMIRKPGKLPGETVSEEYDLEYGTNTLEIQKDLIKPGQKVIIIDDLLAIGGTAKAIKKLVEAKGSKVIRASFVIELENLKGKEKLGDTEVVSILKY